MAQARMFLEDANGESVEIPACYAMCDDCEGAGTVDNPAFSNGITQSDREEMGEESFQRYMDGAYDVTCPCCKGTRVVVVPEPRRLTFAHRRLLVLKRQEDREEYAYQREVAAERAFCFGY